MSETERGEPDGKTVGTGRSAQFWAPIETEADVEALAQRVAQHCAVALQRQEADRVRVLVQEASVEGAQGDE